MPESSSKNSQHKKIPLSELVLGMYVTSIFDRNNKEVQSEGYISTQKSLDQLINSKVKFVVVNPDKQKSLETIDRVFPDIQVTKPKKAVVAQGIKKTPFYDEGDFDVKDELSDIITNTTKAEASTTYLGVLEHYKSNDPDMLCVVRRKRGFFTKKWEKNIILKKDFNSALPVLVLSGLK